MKLGINIILVLSATLCSSDAVAALTMINQETQSRLFSVVFGEGLVNDAVSIIIFGVAKDVDRKSPLFSDFNVDWLKWEQLTTLMLGPL